MSTASNKQLESALSVRGCLLDIEEALRDFYLSGQTAHTIPASVLDQLFLAANGALDVLDSVGRLCCLCIEFVPCGEGVEHMVSDAIAHAACARLHAAAAAQGDHLLPSYVFALVNSSSIEAD